MIARGIARAVFVEDGAAIFAARIDGSFVRLDAGGVARAALAGVPPGVPLADLAADERGHAVVAAFEDGRLLAWTLAAGGWEERLRLATDTELQTADVAAGVARIATGERTAPGGDAGIDRGTHQAGGSGTHDADAAGTCHVRVLAGDGRELVRFPAHDDWIRSVRFSPDGTRLFTTSRDNTGRLWSTTGELLGVLAGHEGTIARGTFSSDGRWLATASTDRTARLWNAAGEAVAVLRGHRGQVWDVVFSPDGERLYSAAFDRFVRSWPVTTAALEAEADALVDRPFTPGELERYAEYLR